MCNLANPFELEETVSERFEQPKEKKLTPPEVYRMAAEIYEKLPEGQKLEVIEALCNMVGRTAVLLSVAGIESLKRYSAFSESKS